MVLCLAVRSAARPVIAPDSEILKATVCRIAKTMRLWARLKELPRSQTSCKVALGPLFLPNLQSRRIDTPLVVSKLVSTQPGFRLLVKINVESAGGKLMIAKTLLSVGTWTRTSHKMLFVVWGIQTLMSSNIIKS